jgi:vancomycin resistance protein YoaR
VRRLGLIAVATLAALAGAAIAAVAARDAVYWERPLPGVVVRNVALSDGVQVSVGGKPYSVDSRSMLRIDERATAAAAVERGRDSFLTRVRALVDPSPPALPVNPVLVPAASSEELVASLERALPRARPAQVSIKRVVPSRPGERIDRPAFLAALRSSVLEGGQSFTAPLRHVDPELQTPAAEAAFAEAQELVAEPITLSFQGQDVGTLEPARLAKLIRFRPDGDSFRIVFAPARIAKAVEPFLTDWRRRAVNARFVVDGAGVRISPSRPGLAPDGPWIADSLTSAASSSIRRASLRLKQTRADLTTREAEKLGIRRQISTFTTDMGTSSSNRIHNVQLMAEFIDGTIVRPGQTFSFNDSVGPRTAERGFREGQMIVGSLLLPAIGGGVCQTATTLFNNAFELGLPIVERHNHSFYISHYPMGRDATVSWGGPDFSFKNDLKSGILIKTRYTDSTLTFSFYGTDPQRRIVSSTGPRVNWRSPRTTYALDPYAPRGSVRTVSGSNQSGFDVTVSRKVFDHGKLKRRDAFTSAYIAVGPTQIYGPGRSIPGPYFVLPRV